MAITYDQAYDLMKRSMTTGVKTSEFNALGGYDAVKAVFDAGGGTYSYSDIPQAKQDEYKQEILSKGSGNFGMFDQGAAIPSDVYATLAPYVPEGRFTDSGNVSDSFASYADPNTGLTYDIAYDLMKRSMTTGVPTAEFNKYGGYDAVKSLFDQGGGTYSYEDIDPSRLDLDALAQKVSDTGSGSLAYMDYMGYNLSPEAATRLEPIFKDQGLQSLFSDYTTLSNPQPTEWYGNTSPYKGTTKKAFVNEGGMLDTSGYDRGAGESLMQYYSRLGDERDGGVLGNRSWFEEFMATPSVGSPEWERNKAEEETTKEIQQVIEQYGSDSSTPAGDGWEYGMNDSGNAVKWLSPEMENFLLTTYGALKNVPKPIAQVLRYFAGKGIDQQMDAIDAGFELYGDWNENGMLVRTGDGGAYLYSPEFWNSTSDAPSWNKEGNIWEGWGEPTTDTTTSSGGSSDSGTDVTNYSNSGDVEVDISAGADQYD